ncbi:MAG: lipoprotein, partial [Desulfuromonadales bacterium]|nr:lipoprotein [Desulfuromonadales bacterium]
MRKIIFILLALFLLTGLATA